MIENIEIYELCKPFSYWSVSKKMNILYTLYYEWKEKNLKGERNCRVHGWEIDLLAVLFIISKNGQDIVVEKKDYAKVFRVLDKMRLVTPPNLDQVDIMTLVVSIFFSQQAYPLDSYKLIKIYRMRRWYNDSEIIDCLGNARVKEMIEIMYDALFIDIIINLKIPIDTILNHTNVIVESKKKLFEKYLSKDINYHVDNLNKNIKNLKEFVFQHVLVKKYPYLKIKDRFYLVGPRYIIDATTRGILEDAITGDINKIHMIGKVLERYIVNMATETENYVNGVSMVDETSKYNKNGNKNLLGEDLVLREDETIFLISSKFKSIPKAYRLGSVKALKKVNDSYIDAIDQSFKYYCDCGKYYFPFGNNCPYNNKFCIILVEHYEGIHFEFLFEKWHKENTYELDNVLNFKKKLLFIKLEYFESLMIHKQLLSNTIINNYNKNSLFLYSDKLNKEDRTESYSNFISELQDELKNRKSVFNSKQN